MNVLVAGGSGFIGRRLVDALADRGDQVTVISRDPAGAAQHARNGVTFRGWLPPLDGYDGVVNLSGAGIFDKRWSSSYRTAIRESRISTTKRIVQAILAADDPPRVLVNGSAIGFYGSRGEEQLPESASPGRDFLADVCQAWEAEATKAPVRTVMLRTGVVLGNGGGALAEMLPPFKLGLGGPIGSGKAWFSWVHIDDMVGLILFALDNEQVQGPMNCTSPGVVTNKVYTKALGAAIKRPTVFPIPPLALKLKLGGVAEVLTGSQRCVPETAQSAGYAFKFPEIGPALTDLLGS